jgi:pimeloyl-ACP methyl ester carboxylesterase
VDAAIPPADGTRVIRGTIGTRRVREPVRYALVLPPGRDVRTIDAIAYLLPGRGGSADGAVDTLGFAGFLAEAVRSGTRPFALAAVDAGESYFHPRRNGEDRLGVVTDDLPRVIRAMTGRPLREALVGQSMGGYGALLAAELQPGRYRCVAVAGPALFSSYDDERRSVGDAFDGPDDFARHDVIAHAAALKATAVYLRCGNQDPFAPGVRALARALPHADAAFVAGCHDDGFWRATASGIMRFVGAHIAP